MKISLRFLAFIFFISTTAFAQLVSGQMASDFTITDTDGKQHNLYSILDEGKPVLIDLFASWCQPCWVFTETGVFKDFNSKYGSEGDNSAFTIAIESDPETPSSALFGSGNTTIGDWSSVIDYPLADDPTGSIGNDFGLAAYPSIYLICPDRTITEIGLGPQGSSEYWTLEALTEKVFSCPKPVEGANAAISYIGDLFSCGDNQIEPKIKLFNMGAEEMTSSKIQTIVDGSVISSYDWSGSLTTYRAEDVTLNRLPPNTSKASFKVVLSGDAKVSDDKVDVDITISKESHAYVHIQVNTDDFPSETSWSIINFDNGNTVMTSGSYERGSAGDGSGGPDARKTFNYFKSLEEGCYVFIAEDEYGDGQDWQKIGSIILNDGEGQELLNISGNWGAQQFVLFEVTHGLGIEEVTENSILIFPNPASNNASVSVNLPEPDEVTLKVLNTLGQEVFSLVSKMNAGQNTIEIPVEKLTTGIYYVTMRISDELVSKKLNIVK